MTVRRVHRQEISSLLSIHLHQGMFDEVLRQAIEQAFQPMDVAVEQYLQLAMASQFDEVLRQAIEQAFQPMDVAVEQ